MAFVSRSEKRLPTFETISAGPGAYMSHKDYSAPPSYAPFASTSDRDTNKHFQKNFTPGPGTYLSSDLKPPISTDLDHWGQPKYSSSFASQLSRFNTSKDPPVPGPGSYIMLESWSKAKQQFTSSGNINWARIPSAPSIPTNAQSHGYDQSPTGELIMHSNQGNVYSGGKGDSVGPGHYNVDSKSRIKGPKWQKSNSSRDFHKTSMTGPTVGPGSYIKTKVRVEPMYKFKQSAAFACAVSRDAESQNGVPGPGSYSSGALSSFNKKKVPKTIQNFGSSSSRFKESVGVNDVGPGHYNEGATNSRVNSESKAPFASSNVRFQYKANTNPGPGSYKKESIVEVLVNKTKKSQGAFGSGEKRFYSKDDLQTPGPGQYKTEPRKSASRSPQQNAVFSSKVKRDLPLSGINNPSPGTYEVKSGFFKTKLPIASMHPVLSRITYSDPEGNVGFSSSTQRFNDNTIKRTEDLPGPGAYHVEEDKKGKQIIHKAPRFKPVENTLPGPGAYYEEVEDKWNKKSYNVLFSEVL